MKNSILAIMLCVCASASNSAVASESAAFDHTHAEWTKLLKQYVTTSGSRSQVKYAALKQHPEELNRYLGHVGDVTTAEFSRMPEGERLAFLINAYNALTVKLIIDHYPVKSIRDIGGLFSNPWKKKFFKLFGAEHSLDDIEHEMIRNKFSEPRIHFALVCASKGCPALKNEAFVAARLSEQLDSATNLFLRDSQRNRFDSTAGVLHLSSIFKWYGEDFEKKYGSVKEFVASTIAKDSTEANAIRNAKTTTSFLDYDWTLNE